DGIKKLEGAHDLEPGDELAPIRRRLGWGPQDDVPMTEPRPRELSVVSRRVARRRLIIGTRLLPAPQRFCRASLPLARARPRDRTLPIGSTRRLRPAARPGGGTERG